MTVKHWAGCFLSHSGLGNRFSVPFLMTCYYSGVVCHSTNSAIWGRMNNERPEKVVNHVLRSKKMAGQISSAFAANLISPAEPEEENLRSVCSPFFLLAIAFPLSTIIILIIPILPILIPEETKKPPFSLILFE